MCGIAGYFSRDATLDPQMLERATEALAHRGPDGQQVWISPERMVGLGHTRLAIIDLETGQQPMSVLDGRLVGSFNGEIYNYRELRAELDSLGYRFHTKSDTEVLLLAFGHWGEQCFSRLDGMFAFAVYDTQNRKLLLARDRTGIKPLYYHQAGNNLVYGSELKSILAWQHVPRRAHSPALADCLSFGYPLLPATCFKDCWELEPATFLEFSEQGVRKQRYWSWERNEFNWSEDRAIELLEDELTKAVCEQQVADVPLGAFLSGGLDSSLLVALLARSQRNSIKTFTVKFDEPGYDESSLARTVAQHIGSEHHELRLERMEDGPTLVGKVLDQFDQPFGDSSAIPTYLLSREIRRHVKVVIGGDGGDEMFGGYPRFAWADLAQVLGRAPRIVLQGARSVLGRSGVLSPERQRQVFRLIRAAAAHGAERLTSLCSLVSMSELSEMIDSDFQARLGNYHSVLAETNGHRHVGGAELIDATVRTTLPADYLRKVDVMSSAHGLEVRVPMLSNRVLAFASKLPNRWKYAQGKSKILLRKLAELRLPTEVARKKKQGFGIPLDTWLGSSGRVALREVLEDARSSLSHLIRPTYIQQLMGVFCSQKWDHSRWSRYGVYQRAYILWSLHRWIGKWQPSL